MIPKRIQRQRTKGWRMPDGAIYVGRPSKWGNPFRADYDRNGKRWRVLDDNGVDYQPDCNSEPSARRKAVNLYYADLIGGWSALPYGDIGELRGCNLACWCPLNRPCHADVLLELANQHRDRTIRANYCPDSSLLNWGFALLTEAEA